MGPTAVVVTGVALLGLLLPPAAWANIGPPWWGDPVTEPRGVNGVAITHEDLRIDLRPLAALQPVRVDVVYRLDNPGAAKQLDLLFVSGTAEVSDFEVRLDGRPLESSPLPREQGNGRRLELPKSWEPRSAAGIEGGQTYYRLRYAEELVLLAFTVDLPAGPSVLTAHYRARASGTDEGYPTATWLFPYVLAPAREWGRFGGLDVTAYLPEGWQSASSPALEREGSVLRGSFPDLPADSLTVAARAPVGPELRRAVWLYVSLYVLAVLSGGVLCWWAGRSLGLFLAARRRSEDRAGGGFAVRVAPVALLLAVLWAILIYGAARLTMWGVFAALAGQESPYFHEPFLMLGCATFLLILVALPGGIVLTWASARRGLAQAEKRAEMPAE